MTVSQRIANARPNTGTWSTTTTEFLVAGEGNTTTTDRAENKMRGSYTAKNGEVRVGGSNTRTADNVFTFRINAADTSLVVTVTAGNTGTFEDTSNTASISSTDEINWRHTGAAGSGAHGSNLHALTLEHATGAPLFCWYAGGTGFGASSTNWVPLVGGGGPETIAEANATANLGTAQTLNNLGVKIAFNNVAAAISTVVRVEGSNSSLSASVTASTTGWFEDTSNTASVSAQDSVKTETVRDATAGSWQVWAIQCFGDETVSLLARTMNSLSVAGNTTTYLGLGNTYTHSTESNAYIYAKAVFTAQKYGFYLSSAGGSPFVGTFRVNGGSSSITATAPTSTAGEFLDSSNTVALVATDEINWMVSRTAGSFSATLRPMWMEMDGAAAAAADPFVQRVGNEIVRRRTPRHRSGIEDGQVMNLLLSPPAAPDPPMPPRGTQEPPARRPRRVAPDVPSPWMRLLLAEQDTPPGRATLDAPVRRPRRGPGGLTPRTDGLLHPDASPPRPAHIFTSRRPTRAALGFVLGTNILLHAPDAAAPNQAQYLMPSRRLQWRTVARPAPLILTGALNLLLDAVPPVENQAQYAMPSRNLRWRVRDRRDYMHTPLGSYLDLLVTPYEMASTLIPSKVVRRRDTTWRSRSVTLANPLGLLLEPNDLPDGVQLTPMPAPLRRRVPRGIELGPLPTLEPTAIGDPVVRVNDFTRAVRVPRRVPLDHTRGNPLGLLLTFATPPIAVPLTPPVVRRRRRVPLSWSSSGLLLLLPPSAILDPPPGMQLTPVPVRVRDALRHWRSFAGYNAALLHDAGSDFLPEVVTYLLGLIPGYPDVIDLGALAGFPDVLNLATLPGYPDVIEVGDIARG